MKIASFPRSESIAQNDGVANSTVQIRYRILIRFELFYTLPAFSGTRISNAV
jgi:hypothetical protein